MAEGRQVGGRMRGKDGCSVRSFVCLAPVRAEFTSDSRSDSTRVSEISKRSLGVKVRVKCVGVGKSDDKLEWTGYLWLLTN